MAGTHRLCESISPIEVAAKNVKKSTMLEDTAKEFSNIIKSLESLDKEQAVNEKNLEVGSDEIVTTISTVKVGILKKVNDMEKQTITQLETLKKKHVKAIESNRTGIKSLKELTSKCLEEMDFTVKNGSHKQIFLLLQSLKHQVHEQGERLENMTSTFKTTSFMFHGHDDVLQNIDNLGEIMVNTMDSDVVYNPVKHRQAQVLPKKKSLLQFTYESQIKTVKSVRSIVMTEDNRIIICSDDYRHVLYTCEEYGKNDKIVLLQSSPFRLALIPGQDMVVVVIHGSASSCNLQFIDVKSLTSDLETKVYGIAATKSNIFLGGVGFIHVLDTNAKYIRRINVSPALDVIKYIHADQNGRLYASVPKQKILFCLEQDGTVVFCYQTNNKRFWPEDITTDPNGCVYVVNISNGDIHRLSPEGKFIDVIAGEAISSPWTCCFNKKYTKLFLPTNDGTGGTLVFSCK